MKVAILAPNFFIEAKEVHGRDRITFGGGERYLVELCKLLQSEGHYVTVFQPLRPGKDGVKVDGFSQVHSFGELHKEWNSIRFVCLQDDDRYGYNVNPTMNMIFNENSRHYDLSVYFGTYMAFPYAVSPSISVNHGIYWDYPYHPFNLFNKDKRDAYLEKHLYGFTACDICISVDSNVKKVIQAIRPGMEKNIKIIYNFVDTEVFTPKPSKNEKIKVLCPRRLTILRGSNDFIRASKQYPDYEYLSVGQATETSAQQQLEAWGKTTPHIKFIHKDMEQMPEVYQESDISVIPTMACEGLSLSLLESMSCGLPVITTPVGGLGDAVIHGYNAFVYDPQFEELGEYIDILAKDEKLREKFGARNREIAVESFDIKIWQKNWQGIIDIFK